MRNDSLIVHIILTMTENEYNRISVVLECQLFLKGCGKLEALQFSPKPGIFFRSF